MLPTNESRLRVAIDALVEIAAIASDYEKGQRMSADDTAEVLRLARVGRSIREQGETR